MTSKNLHLMYAYPAKMKSQQEIAKAGTNITLPDGLKADDVIGALGTKGVVFGKDGTALKGYATSADTVTLTTSDVVMFIVCNETYDA